MTLTPSATLRTFIILGSFMYCPNLSGCFCTSPSMAMKSGCARYPRVLGSVASLPYSSGLESIAPMSPMGSPEPPPRALAARALAALASSRPEASTALAGSSFNPASYASTASS